jgi:hypothetical protein
MLFAFSNIQFSGPSFYCCHSNRSRILGQVVVGNPVASFNSVTKCYLLIIIFSIENPGTQTTPQYTRTQLFI